MVLKVNVTISPADLTDLYVINDNFSLRPVKRLSDYELSGNVLTGSIEARQSTDTIKIISSGYVEQVLTFSDIQTNPNIVLVSSNEVENLSNGSNTYPLADKTARELIDSLDDIAFNGVKVDQTYDGASTSPQSGRAVAEAISDLANKDLSNLTSQGKNIANWSSNVSNCITEIPQDISLTLSGGVETLKAGSKVYVPNGASFDEVTISQDYSSGDISSISEAYTLFYNTAGGLALSRTSWCYSGTSAPASPSAGYFWYDTTNNVVKRYDGSSWVSGFSLPVGVVFSGATSHQVFNGFGYIGSTVFALPGVKGLIPDGRNADGSLKNIDVITSSILISTLTGSNRTFAGIVYSDGNLSLYRGNKTNITYDKNSNYNIDISNNSTWSILPIANTTGDISSFTPKTAFHALDYSDSSTISGWSAPSSKYINLTLGASGANYTAPANGYYNLYKASNAAAQYVAWRITPPSASGIMFYHRDYVPTSGNSVESSVYVSKGSIVQIAYTLGGATTAFNFVYAEGE